MQWALVIFWDLSPKGNVISIVDRVTETANPPLPMLKTDSIIKLELEFKKEIFNFYPHALTDKFLLILNCSKDFIYLKAQRTTF